MLIKLNFVTEDGGTSEAYVNPQLVCAVIPVEIPGALSGPGGKVIPKLAAAIDFGLKMIPVDNSIEEVVRMINKEL